MAQAAVGQDFIAQYCRQLKTLGIHTTINHHLSMHYLKFIRLFGPVYGWWLFAFERFNGMLEKVKLNGHDGGRIELTMLRNWVMTHLIYEYILALPADAPEMERAFVEKVVQTEGREKRGSMMTELAIYRSEASAGNNVSLPAKVGKPINVCEVLPDGLCYRLLLQHLRNVWPDLNLIDDNSNGDGTPFYRSSTCCSLAYIKKDGVRFGSTSNKRTQNDCYAFMSGLPGPGRIAVEITAILSVKIADDRPPHICAVVRRMSRTNDIPAFPWDLLYGSTCRLPLF
jgi:hypothetical protein